MVARWFHEFARSHGQFDATLVDLAEMNLPLYDEPHHPRTQTYTKEHTKAWASSVAAADAYVFVTPEYNYCPPPAFVNALDYVYVEWNYKPCGFVSYGGLSGGMRAVQLEKQLVTTLKMMPMVEGVAIPMVAQSLDAQTGFKSNASVESAAKMMLDELHKWAQALKPMRD
jgi:NAD(P)H-dependent FMN reductase